MGKEKAWSSLYLTLLFHLAFPTPPYSMAHGAGLRATMKSLAHLCSTAEEDGREIQGWHRIEGDKTSVLSLEFFLFMFLQAWWSCYLILLQSIQGIQLFVHLFEKQPALRGRDEEAWPSSA